MVNKSMRCAVKVAGNTSTRLRSAAADEAKAVNGAGDKLPAVSSGADTHADILCRVGSRHRLDEGCHEDRAETATTEPRKSVSRSAMRLAERRDIFGSSDESDAPSPRRSLSLESNQGGGKSQSNYNGGDADMRHNRDEHAGRGVGTSIDIMQEARDRDVLRVAPEKKA
uniref:Uncharacterized protein n=1 Tax=Hyaloperonospora arabidopsidis (strain Emoy2) TaxID=559515 RepID=M4C0T8_HYAAE